MTETPTSAPDTLETDAKPGYQVLARKYRPSDFSGLIGQEALVRTLTNAIQSGRLHHAFVLTGVRGIGKTTTARIIARALNCIGPDGNGGPTAEPCGVCANCMAIAEDRHVDVIEMDAASRTGVDDIRELIEGVRYRPVSARFKIYIIDEVHMLSKNAFNALLKTLEEPPEHVKFVFATTEIRKVPVTVLSRCMRFDLRRVDTETLANHFLGICEKESAQVDQTALGLIARAADGSVRDGLSLLDQAISHASGPVDEEQVRTMLGLADRAVTFDLFDAAMKGDINAALETMGNQYHAGADPVQVMEDLLELTHWLTRVKIDAAVAEAPGVPEMERVRGLQMATDLSMAALTRAWQMLLKGSGELRLAPSPEQAAEMVLIRLAFASDLPSPTDLAKQVQTGMAPTVGAPVSGGGAATSSPASGATDAQGSGTSAPQPPADAPMAMRTGTFDPSGQTAEALSVGMAEPAQDKPKADPRTFDALVALTDELREPRLRHDLTHNFRLIKFEPGLIEFSPTDSAPKGLAQTLTQFLNANTARRWMVTVKGDGGGATVKEQRDEQNAALHKRAADSGMVKALLEAFPDAKITEVKDISKQTSDSSSVEDDLASIDEAYSPLDDVDDLD